MCTCVYMTAIYPQAVRPRDEAASESRPSSLPPGPDTCSATVAPGRTHLPGAHGAIRRPLGNVLPVLPGHLPPDGRGAGAGRRGDGSEERIDCTARLRGSVPGDPRDDLSQEIGQRPRAGGDPRRAHDTRHLSETAGPRNGRAGRDWAVVRRPRPDPILLTHKGIVIARLGEPVFLYLRLAEGWNTPTSEVRPAAEAEGA